MNVTELKLGDIAETASSKYCWLYNPHLESWMFHKIDVQEGTAVWFTLNEIMSRDAIITGNVLDSWRGAIMRSKAMHPELKA
jgi:hypothetical protein